MNRSEEIAQQIRDAFQNPAPKNEVLTGFSGEKLLSTLINLAKFNLSENTVYLEIGVFQGMSLLSVASQIGECQAYGIDNFAFFDQDGKNEGIVKARIEKLQLNNVHLINMDYEDALNNLSNILGDKKIGLFFVDGPHDYRSQLMCLLLAKPFLADNAIIVVDDCNYRHVRLANSDFLQANAEYKLLFEAYTHAHPTNMSESEVAEARKGYWNGINVMVHDPENALKRAYPPTERNRSIHENEHLTQTEKYPTLALELAKYIRKAGNLLKRMPKHKNMATGSYDSLNTYSDKLTQFNLTQE